MMVVALYGIAKLDRNFEPQIGEHAGIGWRGFDRMGNRKDDRLANAYRLHGL